MRPSLLAVALTLLAAAPAQALDLKLRCDGVVTYLDSEVFSTTVVDAFGYPRSTLATTSRLRDQRAIVRIEIHDGAARIQMPQALVPLFRRGGQDGWWPIDELVVGEDEITGQVRMGALTKYALRLDRTHGELRLGHEDFQGACALDDPSQRKF